MKRTYQPITLIILLSALCLACVVPAFAGAEGRQNTALALTAATIMTAKNGDDQSTLALGIASVAAWANVGSDRDCDGRYYDRHYDSHRDRGYNDYRRTVYVGRRDNRYYDRRDRNSSVSYYDRNYRRTDSRDRDNRESTRRDNDRKVTVTRDNHDRQYSRHDDSQAGRDRRQDNRDQRD